VRKRPQVVNFNPYQPRFTRPPNYAVIERPAKEFGKDR